MAKTHTSTPTPAPTLTHHTSRRCCLPRHHYHYSATYSTSNGTRTGTRTRTRNESQTITAARFFPETRQTRVAKLQPSAASTSSMSHETHKQEQDKDITVMNGLPGTEQHNNRKGSPSSLRVFERLSLSEDEKNALLARPRKDFKKVFDIVQPIIDKVRNDGDSAVFELTKKFDLRQPPQQEQQEDNVMNGNEFGDVCVKVSSLPDPSTELKEEVRTAFDVAIANITKFHSMQKMEDMMTVETMEGVRCSRLAKPIDSVGLYVPGGTAVLPSTAAMLSVPAMVAGCETVVLATPPRPDGSICPEVVYVAKKVGVDYILKAGGAQAVAAMAYGTETCPKVHKIFGPGNQFVTAAKIILQNSEAMVSIDMPAGPSEVLVIADQRANIKHVAADLLSQAEHGADSQAVLVAMRGFNVDGLVAEIERQVNELPRGEMTAEALTHSFAIIVDDMKSAVDFSNEYAPEHLIINVDVEEAESSWMPLITNAGSVFLGRHTPESVGDYASGTNHVLPTYGYARMYSGVSLDSFVKKITVQSLTRQGLLNLGPHVAVMAGVEGLDAHRNAVQFRIDDVQNER